MLPHHKKRCHHTNHHTNNNKLGDIIKDVKRLNKCFKWLINAV